MRKILAILNARAGTLIDAGADGLRDGLHRAFGAGSVELRLLEPRRMLQALADVGPYDTLIVGGGDGSVGCAVGALAGSDKTLGIIPCGTLNLLARDLGMPVDPQEAIAALGRARPRRIDLATINGRPFHTLSGLGFFSQMARAREEARDLPGKLLRVGAAAVRAMARTGRFSLEVEIDGKPRHIESYAVLVTCNRFGGTDWRREVLDGGMLEVHIAQDEGALARLKAGADLLTGDWRDNEGIISATAHEVRIASSRPRAWVATDGELQREHAPLRYEIRPRALTVLAPEDAQAAD